MSRHRSMEHNRKSDIASNLFRNVVCNEDGVSNKRAKIALFRKWCWDKYAATLKTNNRFVYQF